MNWPLIAIAAVLLIVVLIYLTNFRQWIHGEGPGPDMPPERELED